MDYTGFDSLLVQLRTLRDKPQIDEKTVNSSTFWLLQDDTSIVGVVNIRHRLNKYLLEIGGHIGYGIRPSERRKGYATEMLRLSLLKAGELGLTNVLVTCDKDNLGSAKTIKNNGGVLDSEAIVDGVKIQRYWINIKSMSGQ
ncbi:GNAT family N-acetyltransferase [Paenibacillus sp. J5C_2022]|uniref:GNAT family N-acetyltransferase n=1 Tax=Paenibacillus sp. J5C2022 TaxID=2977129 RepID=UPI0021D09609|nr:GNAT family N-acetyltransferase [Paenibacillus sp. J5C2022]MCU6713020.1 GNAT family N-acetyltransferase [Paenibacillus sp. J5C2022]